MANYKKGSAAAKAYMAKLRAARGKTKVGMDAISNDIEVRSNVKNRTFTITKNGTTYKTGKFSKPEFEELEYNTKKDWDNFLRTQNNYSIVKVGAIKKASSMHKDTKSHNVNIRVVSGTDTKRLEYGELYDTYLQLYLVKFANLSFSIWAVTGEGLTKALKHPEGKNQAPIVYRVKSFGIPKFEKMTIKELKDFK